MTKLRVLHLISGLATGGSEMMLYKLLATMDSHKFEQSVVSLTPGGSMADRIRGLGIEVYDLGMRAGLPGPGGMARLLRLLHRWRPAVLQTWLYHADLLGTVCSRLGRHPALAWNLRCSRMDARYERGLGGLVLRGLIRMSAIPDVVVVNSAAGRKLHEGLGYRARRWELVPNGFDIESFRPAPESRTNVRSMLGIPVQHALIGLIARFDPIKDHATFLRAAALLSARDDAVTFLLAGKGVTTSNSVLQDLVERLGLAERVRLLGERSDIAQITAALDVASCTSIGEGFPNTIGEAMACGVPVVMTDVGDARDILGDTGIVVPGSDPGSLAEAWASLLALPAAQREQTGLAARQRVVERFDIRQIARRYEDLYRELATSRQVE